MFHTLFFYYHFIVIILHVIFLEKSTHFLSVLKAQDDSHILRKILEIVMLKAGIAPLQD